MAAGGKQQKRAHKQSFTFIDLFAGIGGFHIAAENLGGKCVFVSEFNTDAQDTYTRNFKPQHPSLFTPTKFVGDITTIDEKNIAPFDFLFAGFPCQPFSKGGHRKGFEDTRGTLFFDIARIVKYHQPKFLLLENVANLVSHDHGRTYETITSVLRDLGYVLNDHPLLLSPHYFGVPAIRQRLYIPAIRKDLVSTKTLDMQFATTAAHPTIYSIIDTARKPKKYYISEYETKVLDAWDAFYHGIDVKVIGFPIWATEFRETYSYTHLPQWKQNFIAKNRALYTRNKKFIDAWLKKHKNLEWMVPTHRKMEWQAGTDITSVYEGLIQFRPSGVRIKRPDKFSTLVAMNHPQIVGRYRRRLTPDETKRLQSFPETFQVHANDAIALRQLGNAVNVSVVTEVVRAMFATCDIHHKT